MSTVLNPSYALTLGNLRSLVVPTYTGESLPSSVGINPRGALITTQDLPPRAELTRFGNSVVHRTDEVACVTAIPTTTAPHTFWNGEANGGKSYVIDRLVWTCTTSAAAASAFSLVALVNVAATATVPSTADTQIQNGTTGKTYSGKAKSSHAVTVADDGWFPIGNSWVTALTATVGSQVEAFVNGAIILAPGYVMGVACVAVNTTAKGKLAIYYHELALPVVTS